MTFVMAQDALYKEHASKPTEVRLTTASDLLIQASGVLMDQQRENLLDYLEAVAAVRFTLSIVAELIIKQITDTEIQGTPEQATQLIEAAKDICTNPSINRVDITNVTGPIVYLLKLLVRQFGTPCLQKVVETHAWVIPPELRRVEEVNPANYISILLHSIKFYL